MQPAADFCDENPDAEVLQGRYLTLGGKRGCLGRAETISTRDDNSLVKEVLSEPGNGRVLFVDNSASTNCAMLGGNLAELAAGNGWAGIVIHGAVRDLQELEQAPVAVFALASCPRRSKKHGAGVRSKPIRIGGAYIQPEDIIAADSDGVVILASWAAHGRDV
jgi:regulator of ribonuclease activity A